MEARFDWIRGSVETSDRFGEKLISFTVLFVIETRDPTDFGWTLSLVKPRSASFLHMYLRCGLLPGGGGALFLVLLGTARLPLLAVLALETPRPATLAGIFAVALQVRR